MQHHVIKFVGDLWQVGDFPRVLMFSPPMKLTATITEILLTVTLNTITLAYFLPFFTFLYKVKAYSMLYKLINIEAINI